MRCATHPSIETNLACGKCGKPICPKCLVHTPVGARCRDCAGLRRLPTYQISTQQYLKASGVGLGMAVATGIVWYVIGSVIPFLWLLVALPAGYIIGEAVSLSVNRKRGRGLQAIAGVSLLTSYVIASILPQALLSLMAGGGVGGGALLVMAIRTILGSLTNLYALILLAIGVIIAASRLR